MWVSPGQRPTWLLDLKCSTLSGQRQQPQRSNRCWAALKPGNRRSKVVKIGVKWKLSPSTTFFKVVIVIAGPACSISIVDTIWYSCVVRVLMYVLQKKNHFLVFIVCTRVLQITVWFWIHFEQIFRTSPAACKPDWFTHPRLFSSSNHSGSFPPSHPIDACRHVA